MRLFLGVLLLSTLALRTTADGEVSAQAFTENEFKALYELMVQYKYGQADNCPLVIKYDAQPTQDGDDLVIRHQDMKIGDDGFKNCTDIGAQRVTLAENLRGRRLADFTDRIDGDLDKRTVFEGLQNELVGKKYYVSVSDSPRTCGEDRWFKEDETFFYFDESETIRLTVVAKVTGGEPKFLSLPLVGNIRYMISVTSGTTCIYRVQTDVANVILGTARPSDSPSSTPRPSVSSSPSASASVVPIPSSTLSATPSPTSSESASTFPSTSPSPSMSVSQTTSPTPSVSSSSSPSVSSSSSPSVSSSSSPSVSSSSSPSVSSTSSPSLSSSPSPSKSSSSAPSLSPSSSSSGSPSSSPSVSSSSSPSVSSSSSPSASSTSSPSPTPSTSVSTTASRTPSTSASRAPSSTPSTTPTRSSTPRPSLSRTPTQTPTPSSSSPSQTLTVEQSLSPTRTPIAVATTVVSAFPSPSPSPSISSGSQFVLFGSATPSTTPSSLIVPLGSATPSNSPTPSSFVPGAEPGSQFGTGSDDRNSSTLDGTSTCFPASAVVMTRSGVVRMDELKLGDFVWTGSEFSKVMMFTHQNSFKHARFVKLTTAKGSITLTGGHYLYVNGGLSAARGVEVGDRLSNGEVLVKESVVDLGLYNPQTESGEIVVDGVLASCYTDAVIAVIGHALLTPIRIVKEVVPGVVGLLGRRIEEFVDGWSSSG